MPTGWSREQYSVLGWNVSVLARRASVPGAEPPLVLIHGLIAAAESFRKLVDLLPADRDCFALDMPGAGYSERPGSGDVSFHGMACAVEELVRLLGLERPVLLGHSHGGAIALRVAASGTLPLSGIVLISTAHPFSRHEDRLVRFYLTWLGRRFARLLPHLPARVLLFGFRRMPGARGSISAEDYAPYLHTIRVPGTIPHVLRMLESWAADMERLGKDLRAQPLAMPALVIWGTRDIVVPVSTATGLMQVLPAGKLVALEGIGHLPIEEAPVACAAAVSGWMDEMPARLQEGGRASLDAHPKRAG